MILYIEKHTNRAFDSNPIVYDDELAALRGGKDSDKYKFFVKATLLDDIQQRLMYVKDQVKEMDKLIKVVAVQARP